VWLLLLALVGWYATLIPRFGSFEITSIVKNGLPFAYLAVAQAVIVIAGGIDLSVGAMMVLTNSVAARYMEGQPLAVTLLLGVIVIVGAAILNGSVGWIIERSRVPDIVVTLATSFIFSGLALLVLPSPGGGTSDGFRWLFSGSSSGIGTNFWPSMVALLIPVAVVAWWLGTTRPGLSLYALGSSRTAAYLSGSDVRRSKMVAYAVGGMFAALAGLATTAIIGRGDPRFSLGANATLNSVAAIVLGGIALTGGIGSVIGAVAAGIVLFFLNPVLTAMGIDPNQAQVVQGLLIALVMMVAGLLELRRQRAS
ncbi:MAG: ABC transporter permease, partial [Acidimicrobiia bacterium]|nr:ABC transporter permease [Acidimicrobiia bacterium]